MIEAERPSVAPLRPVTPDVVINVARQFVASVHGDDAPSMTIDEVWIDMELGLCVRHRRAGVFLGRRIADVARDLVSMGPQLDSATQGVVLYHTMFDTPELSVLADAFVDHRGYAWWGWEPEAGWTVVDAPQRLATVLP